MATENLKRSESRRGNRPVRLAATLEKSLSAYASAAAAAGVSLLALTPAANAKIVYTPAHTSIPVNEGILLDLNHDGIADFRMVNYAGSGGALLKVGCALRGRDVVPPPGGATCNYQTNQIWGRGSFPSALPSGFTVRPNKSYFQPGFYLGEPMGGVGYGHYNAWSTTRGQWLYAKHRYLGLQFVIKGHVHYGWARLNVTLTHGQIAAVLTGYAYETIPGKPIITGKTKGPDVITLDPATLGHLAAGASQIPAWRSQRK